MGFYFDGSGKRDHRAQSDELERDELEPLRPSPGKSSRTHGGSDVRGVPGKVSLTMRLAQRIDRYARAGRPATPDERAREMVAEALESTGRPLPEELRRTLEEQAAAELGDIQVHTGPASARAAEALDAEAFTVDRDIHFAAGAYDPDSTRGQELIAHEVAHAVQQRGLPKVELAEAAISQPDQAHERYADEFAGLFRSDIERPEPEGALPDATRARMERAFGESFADVRVHPDSPRATGSVHAVTEGRDIHFAHDRYAPGTEQGDWLIGHELAHVVQQTGTSGGKADPRVLEAEADRAAGDAMAGRRPTVQLSASFGAAQAFSEDEDHDTELPEPDVPEPAAESASAAESAAPAVEQTPAAEPAAEIEEDAEDAEEIDVQAELDQIAAEGGGAGGEAAGGGGGGAAVPDTPEQAAPEVSQSKPEEALGSLQGARPDQIAGAMGSVKTAASSDVSQTRAELAENPPQMKSTGESAEAGPAQGEGEVPGTAEGEGEGEARAGEGGEPQGEGDAAAQEGSEEQGEEGEQAAPAGQEGEPAQPEAEAAPAEPPPAASTAQPSVRGEASGSLSEAEVAQMDSAVDAIPTADPAASTGAGEAPTVALEGAADPAQAAEQHGQLQAQIAEQEGQARTDIAQPMGEDDIRTTMPEEVLQAEVAAGQAGAEAAGEAAAAGPELAVDMGGDPAAAIIAREEKGAEIDAALAQAQADMAAERQQNLEERAQREEQAKQEIAALKQQSSAEEAQARQEAQAEVEATRAEWQAEVDKQSAEARAQADSEVQKGLDQVKTEQEQANQQARQHIADGEQKAEAERQKGEREAQKQKDKAKEDSGGFFGWVASAAKSFFDGIKQAVSAALEAARRAIRAVIEAAKKLATQVIERARQAIVATIQAVGKALTAIGDALLAAFPGLRDRFRGLIQGLVDRAVEAVNQIADKLKEGVQKALDLLGQGLDAALGLLEKGLHAIVDVVGGVVQSAIKFAEGMVQAFAAFAVLIKDIAASPMAWLSALGASIMDGIQNHLWGALKTAVNEWLKSKVVELLGIGGMVMQILLQGGIDLGAIAKMAWEGLKSAIPAALITILVEKLVSMIVPAAGAVMAIIEGLQAAWGTLSRIVAAFGAFVAFLKAVKSGKAGPQFAQMLAMAAVVVLDFVSNWLLRKLMKAARKIGRKLKALAKKLAKKFKRRGKGKRKGNKKKPERGDEKKKSESDKKADKDKKNRERLDKAVEAIRPQVQRMLKRGTHKTVLRFRLAMLRVRHRLTKLQIERKGGQGFEIIAKVNPMKVIIGGHKFTDAQIWKIFNRAVERFFEHNGLNDTTKQQSMHEAMQERANDGKQGGNGNSNVAPTTLSENLVLAEKHGQDATKLPGQIVVHNLVDNERNQSSQTTRQLWGGGRFTFSTDAKGKKEKDGGMSYETICNIMKETTTSGGKPLKTGTTAALLERMVRGAPIPAHYIKDKKTRLALVELKNLMFNVEVQRDRKHVLASLMALDLAKKGKVHDNGELSQYSMDEFLSMLPYAIPKAAAGKRVVEAGLGASDHLDAVKMQEQRDAEVKKTKWRYKKPETKEKHGDQAAIADRKLRKRYNRLLKSWFQRTFLSRGDFLTDAQNAEKILEDRVFAWMLQRGRDLDYRRK